jgi:hypothetical protein
MLALMCAILAVGAIAGSVWMLRTPDWMKRSSEALRTKIDPERYSWGFKASQLIMPPALLVWGVLMLLFAVSLVV